MSYVLDPFLRIGTPTVPAAASTPTPAELLRNARWHAGLSQADVANRAATSQQAVGRYEKGTSVPSLVVLERLLAACGMQLELTVVPQPGLIDQPTRDLLEQPPLDRLPPEPRAGLLALVPVLHALGLPAFVAGKAAARLRGALVRVHQLEFWVDEDAPDTATLEDQLEAAGARCAVVEERNPRYPSTRPRLDRSA